MCRALRRVLMVGISRPPPPGSPASACGRHSVPVTPGTAGPSREWQPACRPERLRDRRPARGDGLQVPRLHAIGSFGREHGRMVVVPPCPRLWVKSPTAPGPRARKGHPQPTGNRRCPPVPPPRRWGCWASTSQHALQKRRSGSPGPFCRWDLRSQLRADPAVTWPSTPPQSHPAVDPEEPGAKSRLFLFLAV